MTFEVTWKIEVDAPTPVEAARRALEIQRDPGSVALVFEVEDGADNKTTVDLWELNETAKEGKA